MGERLFQGNTIVLFLVMVSISAIITNNNYKLIKVIKALFFRLLDPFEPAYPVARF